MADCGIVPVRRGGAAHPGLSLCMELVDAVDSKSTGLAHLGSTPSEATTAVLTNDAAHRAMINSLRSIYTYHIVRHWAQLIAATGLSQRLQNAAWVVPTSQSIHIVSLSLVFGSALMINLRLLGVGRSARSLSELTASLVPWIYGGLVVLLVTGAVQTLTEFQTRQFVTPAFWWKMFMIVCVLALTLWFSRAVRTNPRKWDEAATRPASGKLFALVSLGLWLAIICCGRLIGYTWVLHV